MDSRQRRARLSGSTRPVKFAFDSDAHHGNSFPLRLACHWPFRLFLKSGFACKRDAGLFTEEGGSKVRLIKSIKTLIILGSVVAGVVWLTGTKSSQAVSRS